MKKSVLIISLLIPSLLFADKITDPVKYYLDNYGSQFEDDRILLKAEFDINNDGVKEVFLAYSKTRRYTHLWTVFFNKKNNWVKAKNSNDDGTIEPYGVVSFHWNYFYVGFLDKEKLDYGLLTVLRGKPKMYEKIYIKNDIIQEEFIKAKDLSPEKIKYYDNLIENRNVKIEELKFRIIKSRKILE
jgi:hypothetical protein